MRAWPELYVPQISSRFTFVPLSLFNSASGKVEDLAIKPTYRMYVCGITPYDATHLGHAATYLTFDLIHRYLLATGARVHYVQNTTDIDDPLLERAARDNQEWQTLAQSQIDLFRGDMTDLHVIPPEDYIGVVESIELIAQSISQLKDAGSTYFVEKDLYFKVYEDPDFRTRSNLTDEEALTLFAERGGDPARVGKQHPLDALLWLGNKDGEPGWDSAFGNGRPGWHIECSAIALHYLKPDQNEPFSIDIQGGGNDLIFPHHEMSAAQSRVMTGKPFARTYIHTGMIGLDGEKMSKSRGNLIFVSKLIARGFEPIAIRWALMQHEYARDLMWEESFIESAQSEIQDLRDALSRSEVAPTDQVIQDIILALADNVNTPEVVLILRNWLKATNENQSGGEPGELSRTLDSLLGLSF